MTQEEKLLVADQAVFFVNAIIRKIPKPDHKWILAAVQAQLIFQSKEVQDISSFEYPRNTSQSGQAYSTFSDNDIIQR